MGGAGSGVAAFFLVLGSMATGSPWHVTAAVGVIGQGHPQEHSSPSPKPRRPDLVGEAARVLGIRC